VAKANFGGAQDSSQTLLFMYQSYAQRQEDMANAAIREAEEAQAAEDQDAMNRWEAGEMSDAEWLAYAKGRLASSTDEEEQTQWREVIRNSKETITVRRIEAGAEDLMNRIESGTATWQDLRNFYAKERAGLKEGSELYRQITKQIDGVNDTIRDNATEGAIGQAQYLFQSGQISGAEAANRIRAAAARYQTSDPGKYYQLLSSAYDLQTYGSGSGGGGGGGGGGSRGPSLADTIDALEYSADAIDLLNDQFNNGKRIGVLPDGAEVLLGDENGNPTGTWREIDKAMIETLDAKYEAQIANGDRSAVETLQRKEAYIEKVVQPRNTIPREAQFGSLQRDLQRAVELADQDPALGAKAIEAVIGSMERWTNRLNKTITSTDVEKRASDAKVRENPELSAAVRRQTTKEADELRQVTDEFAAQASAFTAAARQAFADPNADMGALMDGIEGGDESAMARMLQGVNAVATVRDGLATGEWARVMTPNGFTAVPMVTATDQTPDGEPIAVRMPDLDVSESQGLVMTLAEIDGRVTSVWTLGDYVPNEAGGRSLLIAGPDGRSFAMGEDGNWTGSDGEPAALPFFGASKSNAQRWVNQNQELASQILARNGAPDADLANLFYRSDRLVTSRENETQRDYNFMAEQSRKPAREREPYQMGPAPVRPPGGAGAPGSTLTQRPGGAGAPGLGLTQGGGLFGPDVKGMGQNLGIKFEVQDRGSAGAAKLRGNRPQMLDAPSIGPRTSVNVRAPRVASINVSRPNVNLPDFSALRARIAASVQRFSAPKVAQLQKARNTGSGGFV
jgi:hypothetical protein